ncbi:Cell-cycle control medial ring component [Metschnikowia aff. pulcherrima]|uniref:Cell-cycle control medial ring component n=1 Tax=Metschnikowia aff. pulcherrima TaxID=2163413 RepID=A0A4P6XV42_9ASCO|nr:Cell-cycle control medial ring component [Metschnikowia aff. pulcherrima]
MSVEFCRTYSQLINLSPDAAADSFYSTEDYNKLGSLGPTLPRLEYAFPKGTNSSSADASVSIQLKSIRPPYKFSTSLDNVQVSQSVYKVKELLISAVDTLSLAGVTPSNLKFMIKSKVLTDTTSISSLVQEGTAISITVMVSAPAAPAKPSKTTDLTSDISADPSESVPLSLSAETWAKIQDVLVADVGAENGAIYLEKFKSVV